MDKNNSQILIYEFSTAFPDPPKSFDVDSYKRWVNNVENQLGITISKESKDKAEELQKGNIDGLDDSYFPSFYYINETVLINYKNELTEYLFKNYHNTFMKYTATLFEYETTDYTLDLKDRDIIPTPDDFTNWFKINYKRLLDNYENKRFYKDKELEDKLDNETDVDKAKRVFAGEKYYKLRIGKYDTLEQIVKASNEEEALELFNPEEAYEVDSNLMNDLMVEEYSYFEPTE